MKKKEERYSVASFEISQSGSKTKDIHLTFSIKGMGLLFAVIYQLLALHLVDCEYLAFSIVALSPSLRDGSFAFVEYESRRDADDAYYEMHNKRIGRDDLLKIEV